METEGYYQHGAVIVKFVALMLLQYFM